MYKGRPSYRPITMTCPTCGIENVSSAEYCDCGYEFVPGTKPTDWPTAKATESPRLFTVKHVLQCWAVGAVGLILFVVISIVMPSVVGVFALLWIVPAFTLAGSGVHNSIFTLALMLLGGSLFCRAVCFTV